MPEVLSGWLLAALVTGALVVFGIRVALFVGSCALAEAGEPRMGKAVVLALVAAAVCVPASWWLLHYLQAQMPSTEATLIGPAHAAWAVSTCIVAWVLPAMVYKLLLPASWKKGVMVAGLEVLLGSLLAALLAGVVLVILAGVQLARRPAPAAASSVPVRSA